jgi:diphthamide biosynthesis protein 2
MTLVRFRQCCGSTFYTCYLGSATEDNGGDPDQPTFSLITGKYRQAKRYGSKHNPYVLNLILHPKAGDDKTSTEGMTAALTLRNQDGALSKLADSAAGE